MGSYPEKTLVDVRAEFRNSAGELIDPTTVDLHVTPPNGVPLHYIYGTDVDLKKESQGIYYMDFDTTGKRGLWIYEFYSTGTGQASGGERSFYIK